MKDGHTAAAVYPPGPQVDAAVAGSMAAEVTAGALLEAAVRAGAALAEAGKEAAVVGEAARGARLVEEVELQALPMGVAAARTEVAAQGVEELAKVVLVAGEKVEVGAVAVVKVVGGMGLAVS